MPEFPYEHQLSEARTSLGRLVERSGRLQSEVAILQDRIRVGEEERGWLESLQALVLEVSGRAQALVQRRVEVIGTKALAAVFPDPYELRLKFELKAGRPECRILYYRGGSYVDPLSSAGGGTVDLTAMGLRSSQIGLSRPPVRPILLLDEPFRFVSRRLIPFVVDLLREMSRRLGIQIIMVTHIAGLAEGADRAFTVEMASGISMVEQSGGEEVGDGVTQN